MAFPSALNCLIPHGLSKPSAYHRQAGTQGGTMPFDVKKRVFASREGLSRMVCSGASASVRKRCQGQKSQKKGRKSRKRCQGPLADSCRNDFTRLPREKSDPVINDSQPSPKESQSTRSQWSKTLRVSCSIVCPCVAYWFTRSRMAVRKSSLR